MLITLREKQVKGTQMVLENGIVVEKEIILGIEKVQVDENDIKELVKNCTTTEEKINTLKQKGYSESDILVLQNSGVV